MIDSMPIALTAFGAGLLASLSPCVYPLLPITVGYLSPRTEGPRNFRRVIAFSIGQATALVLLGLLAVQLGETLGFASESRPIRLAVGLFLILAGVLSLFGRMPAFVTRWNNRVDSSLPGGSLSLLGALLFGAGSAAVLSPCTSPILGGVLAMIATQSEAIEGVISMALYALGFSSVFLILGLGLARLPRSGPWLRIVHQVSAVLLISAGLWQIFA